MAFGSNLFLISLADPDRSSVERLLQHVDLKKQKTLAFEGKYVEKVYFPLNAIVSMLITLEEGKTFETTTIGRDGMLSASAALDSRVSLARSVVKVAGTALMCDAHAFKQTVLERPSLHSAVLRHEQTMFQQTQQNAACRAVHPSLQQVARMLLRTKDLCDQSAIPLTHGLISNCLALRRTTITEAAKTLSAKGTIDYVRGRITIRSVPALKDEACDCYDIVRRHYNSLHRIEHDAEQ